MVNVVYSNIMANDSITDCAVRQKLVDFWNDWRDLPWGKLTSETTAAVADLLIEWIERLEQIQRLLSCDENWLRWYFVDRGLNHLRSITTAKSAAAWTEQNFNVFQYLAGCAMRKRSRLTRLMTDSIVFGHLSDPNVWDFWLTTLEITHVLPPTLHEFDTLNNNPPLDPIYELVVNERRLDIAWYFS